MNPEADTDEVAYQIYLNKLNCGCELCRHNNTPELNWLEATLMLQSPYREILLAKLGELRDPGAA